MEEDVSYEVIIEKLKIWKGREWGLNFPTRRNVATEETWEQKQPVFSSS